MVHLALITALNSSPTPFEWVSSHLQVVGWPVLVYLAWKVSKYFDRASKQIVKTVGQIDLMATNHFPHMESSLSTHDTLLHSMDLSLKTIVENTTRRHE
jgi:hypothetical protein